MILLVAPSQSIKGQWECDYGKDSPLILNKSKYYQCPPVLKEFHILKNQKNFTPKVQPIPSGGGGTYYSEISKTDDEPIELFNKSCLHKCDDCYEKGSNLWSECIYNSVSDKVRNNINNAKKVVVVSVFILLVALLIIIWKKKYEVKK